MSTNIERAQEIINRTRYQPYGSEVKALAAEGLLITEDQQITLQLWYDHNARMLANLASITSIPTQVTDPAHKLPTKVYAIITDDLAKPIVYGYTKVQKTYRRLSDVRGAFNRQSLARRTHTRIVEGEVTWWDHNG